MAFNPFSIFTGDPVKEATAQQRQMLQGLTTQIGGIYDTARTGGLESLQSGQTGALGSIGTGIDTARGDIMAGVYPAITALGGSNVAAETALREGQTGGLAALQGGVQGAYGAFDPLQAAATRYGAAGTQASNASADALGLNGPEGVARATAAFQAGPGYQFQLGQGIDALTRAANAGGMVASGNTLQEAQRYGSGLANQEWGKYISNLAQREGLYAPLERSGLGDVASGRATAALTGGTGGANIFTGTGGRLSDLLRSGGTEAANIYSGASRSLAELASRGGLASADVYSGTGAREADLLRALAGGQSGSIADLGSKSASTFMQDAQAELGGANNFWNALGGIGKLAAGGGFLPSGSYTPWKV